MNEPAKTDHPLLQKVLDLLNGAFKADPAAIHALVCNHVPCNSGIADHPTIQVSVNKVTDGTEYFHVGTLGIVNGIIDELTGRRICVMFSEPDPTTKRCTMLGFKEFKPEDMEIGS